MLWNASADKQSFRDAERLLRQEVGCIGDTLDADRAAFREDYEELVVPFFKDNARRLAKVASHPVSDDAYSFDKFMACSSIVASRCFQVDQVHGDSLVPMADMFNHLSSESVHLECDGNGNGDIEMRIVRPVKAGDQVFNTYGERDNAHLLCKYGFVEQQNPYDTVTLTMAQVADALVKISGTSI